MSEKEKMDDFLGKLQFNIEDKSNNIIKVIGVGGGGSNAVRHMYKEGVENVSFVVCNTDSQALAHTDVPLRLQLGTEGLGVGGDPEKGHQAAENKNQEQAPEETSGKSLTYRWLSSPATFLWWGSFIYTSLNIGS